MALLLDCSDKTEQSENSMRIHQSVWKDMLCARLENADLFVSSVTNILFHVVNLLMIELL